MKTKFSSYFLHENIKFMELGKKGEEKGEAEGEKEEHDVLTHYKSVTLIICRRSLTSICWCDANKSSSFENCSGYVF